MKNWTIMGLLGLVVVLIVGFEPVQRTVNETLNGGTVRGVERCMDYSSSQLLSDQAIRRSCADTFQARLFNGEYATGRAGPWMDQGRIGWSGNLRNQTSGHITTWIRVAVWVYDEEGNETEWTAETPIWIEPLGDADFTVELNEVDRDTFDDLSFCELEALSPSNCMAWTVVEVKGLAI